MRTDPLGDHAPAEAACGCSAAPEPEALPAWYRDRGLLLPLCSGVLLVAGFLIEWAGLQLAATLLFWAALVTGGYTFVPDAVRRLVGQRKLGIGLLRTISAIGAVLLGYLEEAAALAFLYSIAEALEERAMGQARAGLRALLDLVPEQTTMLRGGLPVTVSAQTLVTGDQILLKPGGAGAH